MANDVTGALIQEKSLTDWSASESGYGQSKLVAERILYEAAVKTAIDVVVCRVGQIAGPVLGEHQRGAWNRKEWFPSVSSPLPSTPATED